MLDSLSESLSGSAGLGGEGQSARSFKEDVDRLVKLAEELKAHIEQAELKLDQNRVQQGAMLAMAFGIAFLLYTRNRTDTVFVAIFGVMLLMAVVFVVVAQVYASRLRQKVKPERFALQQVVQMLREVEGNLARDYNWSLLEQVEFRIRLSRFDIGKERGFSLFS